MGAGARERLPCCHVELYSFLMQWNEGNYSKEL